VIIQHLANLPSSCPADSSSLESCISALKSSISALESSLRGTEGSSGRWETFGWLCAVAVGVGIAGEIAVIVSEYLEDLEDWRRGIIRVPDKPPAWRFWFDIAATLLVLGGVFGEAGAAAKIASINSDLRSRTTEFRAKSDQLLAVITEEAGDAVQSAKTAHDEASAVKGIAAEARVDAKDALAKGKAALRSLSQAESDAAKAQAAASGALSAANDAKQEALRIKKEMAWRSLTPQCRNALMSKLGPLGPQRIDFFMYPNDPEINLISGQIAEVLTGWQIVPFQPLGGGNVWGMAIEYDPHDTAAEARAKMLVSVLASKTCESVGRISGPFSSLPTPQNQLPAMLTGNTPVGASIRLTLGKK